MGEDQDEYGSHGHPVIAGLLTAAVVTATIAGARAYLVRASGNGAADMFFRSMRRRMIQAFLSFIVLIFTACMVSYASMTAAYGFAIGAVLVPVILAGPPVLTMLAYAARQAQHLAANGSYLRK